MDQFVAVHLPNIFLFIHIVGIITWLGPTLGAGYFILQAARSRDKKLIFWIHRQFLFLVNVEHLGLALILIGGFGRMWTLGINPFTTPWLAWKLLLVFVFVIPLEILDIYANNFMLAPAMKRAKLGEHSPELQRAFRWSRFAGRLFFPILFIIVPAIFVLAIWKWTIAS